MALSRLAYLVPLVTAACVDGLDTAYSLAEVDGLEVHVSIVSTDDDAVIEVRTLGRETCISLDDSFVVRANGWASDPTRDVVFPGEDYGGCHEPLVRMSVPESHRTGGAIEVLDRTRYVMLPIGGELQRRTARWVTPADGVLRSGEHVEIAWSRSEDLARNSYYSGTVEGDPNGSFELMPGPVGLTGTVPLLSWTVDTEVTLRAKNRHPLRREVAPGETWSVRIEASTAIPARAVL